MAESNDLGVAKQQRGPDIYVGSSLVIGLVAAALGGTGVYSAQDRFTAEDARELKADLQRNIDTNYDGFRAHLGSHPDKDLDERLRAVEQALIRLETKVEDYIEAR